MLALDAALATANLTDELRGEVHLDRARAMVALNNLAAARQDIDRAVRSCRTIAMVWYLSAELARRENNLGRAETDIQRAMTLAGDNPDIVLLAGTIAGQRGDRARAEALYRRVAEQAPNTDAGRAAVAALASAGAVSRADAAPAPPAQSR